jgi:hypothetical protein
MITVTLNQHNLHNGIKLILQLKSYIKLKLKYFFFPAMQCMAGKKKNEYNLLVGKLKERHQMENLCTDGRIILKVILKYYEGRVRTGLIWLWIGTSCRLL